MTDQIDMIYLKFSYISVDGFDINLVLNKSCRFDQSFLFFGND